MFHHRTKIGLLLMLAFCSLTKAMYQNKPVKTFNSAAEFLTAVQEAQSTRTRELLGGLGCLGAATCGICGTFVADEPLASLGVSQSRIKRCLDMTAAAIVGCLYGSYTLFTWSTDYRAALRVAQCSCPRCLDTVLADPRAKFVLNEDMIAAIEDALENRAHAHVCVAH